MNLRDWQNWLCDEQWRGYRLDEIVIDARDDGVPSIRTMSDAVDLLNAYQALRSLFILCSGFNGEGGETVEHFKKYIRDGKLDKYAAGLELGDRLAYLTWLAKTLGYTLEDIAQLNYAKLTARGKREGS